MLENPEVARYLQGDDLAASTRRKYEAHWRVDYVPWCLRWEVDPLGISDTDFAEFLTEVTEAKGSGQVGSLLAAISFHFHRAGRLSPADNPVIRTLQRRLCQAFPTTRSPKKPLRLSVLQQLCSHLQGTGLAEIRDAAYLTLGFFSTLRVAEIAALEVLHIQFERQGLRVDLPQEKGNPEGRVLYVSRGSVPEICPVCHLQRWMAFVPKEGALFRPVTRHGSLLRGPLTTRSFRRILRRRLIEIGVAPEEYGTHSLRRGFVTEAVVAGWSEHDIAKMTGHKTVAGVWAYVADDRDYLPPLRLPDTDGDA